MAKAELSAGYKALAQGLVYDFKSESGEIKNAKWTPHNVKTLFITSKGFIVKGYSSSLPCAKSNSFIKFEGITKEDYVGLFLPLFKLERGLSAVIANVRDIVVVFGNSPLAVPFDNPKEFLAITGYSDGTGDSVFAYANNKSTFDLPVVTFVSCNDIYQQYIGSATTQQAKVAYVKHLLAKTPLTIKDVKLQERDGDDIAWDVIPDSRYVERDPRQSVFPLDDKVTAFTKLSNLVRDSDVLNAYADKLKIQLVYQENYNPDDITSFKFTANRSNYAADDDLRKYMHDNYYKPKAVLDFLLGKQDVLKDSDKDALSQQLDAANNLLSALKSASSSAAQYSQVWVSAISKNNVRDTCVLVAPDYKLGLTDGTRALLDACMTSADGGSLPDFGKYPASLIAAAINTYTKAVILLAQAVLLMDLFNYGFSTNRKEMADSFYITASGMVSRVVTTNLYYIDVEKTIKVLMYIGHFDNSVYNIVSETVKRLYGGWKGIKDADSGGTKLAVVAESYVPVAENFLAQGL